MAASLWDVLADTETMTLGALIEALESFPPEAEVAFDFVYAEPTTFGSWRGDYAELALGYGPSTFPEKVTVGALLERCRTANGHTFYGWKGGAFTMGLDTPVWVANPGEVGYTKLVGVGERWGDAVLVTAPDGVAPQVNVARSVL